MYCCNLFAVIVYVNSFCCMFYFVLFFCLCMKIWCTNCIMYEIKIIIIIIIAFDLTEIERIQCCNQNCQNHK